MINEKVNTDEIFKETLLDSQTIFSGKVLNLRVDTVKLPNGNQATRELIEHPGAVAVVPMLDEDKIVLVRQYRYPVKQALLEIPAGKLDKHENIEACARRELSEETGYMAKEMVRVASIFTTPGFSNELIHVYIAKGLVAGEKHPDDDEFIDSEIYSKSEIRSMIKDGRINDGKTLIGLLLAGV